MRLVRLWVRLVSLVKLVRVSEGERDQAGENGEEACDTVCVREKER